MLANDFHGVATTQDGGQTWQSAPMSAPSMVTEQGTAWYAGSVVAKLPFGAGESQVVFTPGAERYLHSVSMGSETTGLLLEYDWSTSAITWRRTSDGGSTWPAFVPTGLPAGTPYRLKATGVSDAWAQVGDVLFHSQDAGAHWTAVDLPSDVSYWRASDVVVHDSHTLGLPHERGYYLSTDAGAHWNLLQAPGETPWYSDTKLWLEGGMSWLVRGGRIHVTSDLGLTWRQAFGGDAAEDGGSLAAAWFFDDRKGIAVSSAGWLLETTDGGRVWQRRSLTTGSYTPPRLQFWSSSVGWMSGADGISKTTDGGATWWLPVTEIDMNSVNDFHFVDADRGWALVNGRTVVRTTDGGATWQEQFTAPHWMSAIRFINADVGVMVGYGGVIMRTTDGGATWQLRPSESVDQLLRVSFVDAQHGWAVGGQNAVMRTVDGGLTWQRVAVPARATYLHDVRFVDPQHGWIVGDGGTVLATRDGGQTWALQNSGTYRSLHAVFALDPFTAWAVGDGSTVLATATAGN